VAFKHVPKEDDETLRVAMMEEIYADTFTLVSRERLSPEKPNTTI
jgi:hypothetical protein